MPIAATNANASGTPPSCDATADQDSNTARSQRGRCEIVDRERQGEADHRADQGARHRQLDRVDEARPDRGRRSRARRDAVPGEPPGVTDRHSTTAVGYTRNRPTNASERQPCERACPHRTASRSATIVPQLSASTFFAASVWAWVGNVTCAITSGVGQVLLQVVRDLARVGLERCEAGRDGPALQVAERAVVADEVLEPQPRGARVLAVGDDRLRVVAAVHAVARDGRPAS